jgi:GcrA cell cycle regulator
MIWSDEMLAMLTDEWGAKTSISNIAWKISTKFRVNISRNAVSGKAHRLGLEPRDAPTAIKNFRDGIKKRDERLALNNPPKVAKPPRVAPQRPALTIVPPPAPVEPDPSDIGCQYYLGDVPPKSAVKVFRARGNATRYIAASPKATSGPLFDSWAEVPKCGQPRRRCEETGAYDSSYCPHHHGVCHTAPKEPTGQPMILVTPKWRGFAA